MEGRGGREGGRIGGKRNSVGVDEWENLDSGKGGL